MSDYAEMVQKLAQLKARAELKALPMTFEQLEAEHIRACVLIAELGAVLRPMIEDLPLDKKLELTAPWIALANLYTRRPGQSVEAPGCHPVLADRLQRKLALVPAMDDPERDGVA